MSTFREKHNYHFLFQRKSLNFNAWSLTCVNERRRLHFCQEVAFSPRLFVFPPFLTDLKFVAVVAS